MLMNPKDPIIKSGPEAQRELFGQFSRLADGFSADAAIGAAANVLINALRQTYTTRDQAETRYNEMFGRMKTLLLEHYDINGRKKGIFPYHQTIEVAHFNARNEFKKH